MPLPKSALELNALIGMDPDELLPQLDTVPQNPISDRPALEARPSFTQRFGLSALRLGGIVPIELPPAETKLEMAADIVGEMVGTTPAFAASGGVATSLIKGATLGARIARMGATGFGGGAPGGALEAGYNGDDVVMGALAKGGFDAAALVAMDLGMVGLGKFYRGLSSSMKAKHAAEARAREGVSKIIPEVGLIDEAAKGGADDAVTVLEQIKQTGKIPDDLTFPRVRPEAKAVEIPDEVMGALPGADIQVSRNGAIRIKDESKIVTDFIKTKSKGNKHAERIIKQQLVEAKHTLQTGTPPRRATPEEIAVGEVPHPEEAVQPVSDELISQPNPITAPPTANPYADLPVFTPKLGSKPALPLFDNFNFKKGAAFRFFDDRYPMGVSGNIFEIESIHYPVMDPSDLKTLATKVKDPNSFLKLRTGFVSVVNEAGSKYDVPFDSFVNGVARLEKFPLDRDSLTPAIYEQFKDYMSGIGAREIGENVTTGMAPRTARVSSLYDVLQGRVMAVDPDELVRIKDGKVIRITDQEVKNFESKGWFEGGDPDKPIYAFRPGGLFQKIQKVKDEILDVEFKAARRDISPEERVELMARRRTLQKRRFAILEQLKKVSEPLSDFDQRMLNADVEEFFKSRMVRGSERPRPTEPPLTRLPEEVRARLHPLMRELDDGIMDARITQPIREDISAEDFEFIGKAFLGLDVDDLAVATDAGLLTDLRSLLLASGDANTAQGFRSKFGIVSYLNLQNIRPDIVKHAEEELVQVLKYRVIDRGLPVPDDLLVTMRNFSGADQLFATRLPDFIVKVKKSESPIDYVANVVETSAEHSALIQRPISKLIEETENVATASDKILANQVVKQFRKMDIKDIPNETMFYGKKGKGAKVTFLGRDASSPNRVLVQDVNDDIISIQENTFKKNYSPVALC